VFSLAGAAPGRGTGVGGPHLQAQARARNIEAKRNAQQQARACVRTCSSMWGQAGMRTVAAAFGTGEAGAA